VDESGGRVHFQRYTTNYGGPLRKKNLFTTGTAPGGSSMQFFATVLTDVCYRLHGTLWGRPPGARLKARHDLKDLFDRRLKQGRCWRTPCLGWSEFTCAYWGSFREGVTEVDDALSLHIPSMLLGVWDRPTSGRYAPTYAQDARIERGVLEYTLPAAWKDGLA
jgi:CRISPR-associated protein Cas5d